MIRYDKWLTTCLAHVRPKVEFPAPQRKVKTASLSRKYSFPLQQKKVKLFGAWSTGILNADIYLSELIE